MEACQNSTCKLDYPHTHVSNTLGWVGSINDPAKRLPWPDSLKWKRPVRNGGRRENTGGDPYYLFKFGWFSSHSGFQLPFKVDCEDGLGGGDWEALASIIAWKFAFRSVYGIPKGGVALARALDKYCETGYPVLVVDDVLTTGRSMVEAKASLGNPPGIIGVVVFARGPCPNWVWPICTINEWTQSRATGLS